MSLFGKILALLNVFGAIGLACLALLDFNARYKWTHAVHFHDLLVRGLPVNDAEADSDTVPRVRRLKSDEKTLVKEAQDLFSTVGGSPSATQMEEVDMVKADLDAKLQAAANSKTQ